MTILTRMTSERRRLPLSTAGVAIRTEGDNGGERFRGYAAMFNSRTSIGNPLKWGFYEEVAAGAFSKTLSEGDQRMLLDHDSFYVVSRVSAGTLHLAQDAKGLAVDSDLDAELSYVRDLKANVRNGNVTGMSFGFYVVKDDWDMEQVETKDGDSVDVEVRRLLEVRLIEVSAVTFPAYEDTEAELNSVATALVRRGDEDAIERRAAYRPELRDLTGLSRRAVHAAPEHLKEAGVEDPPELKSVQDIDREPAETTCGTDAESEPAVSTRLKRDAIDLRMRGLAARYRLPRD